jgi:hypothetical protein
MVVPTINTTIDPERKTGSAMVPTQRDHQGAASRQIMRSLYFHLTKNGMFDGA